jgi:hypothetical protein
MQNGKPIDFSGLLFGFSGLLFGFSSLLFDFFQFLGFQNFAKFEFFEL